MLLSHLPHTGRISSPVAARIWVVLADPEGLAARVPGAGLAHGLLAHDGEDVGLEALNATLNILVLEGVLPLAPPVQEPPRTHDQQGQRDCHHEVDP